MVRSSVLGFGSRGLSVLSVLSVLWLMSSCCVCESVQHECVLSEL